MKAIFRGRLATISDDYGSGVVLTFDDDKTARVDYGAPTLVIDPTDDQVEAARAGSPIPRDHDSDHEVWLKTMSSLSKVAMDESASPTVRANARKALAEGRAVRPKRPTKPSSKA